MILAETASGQIHRLVDCPLTAKSAAEMSGIGKVRLRPIPDRPLTADFKLTRTFATGFFYDLARLDLCLPGPRCGRSASGRTRSVACTFPEEPAPRPPLRRVRPAGPR